MIDLPRPVIKQRMMDRPYYTMLVASGIDPLIAQLVASRPQRAHPDKGLTPKIAHLDNPSSMQDMDKAVHRLVQAIKNKEVIGLETDHDCDGQTSHAVLYSALGYFQHPTSCIRSYIGHRLEEGYGLSPSVMERILADTPRPSVVITADNGSTDEAQIAILQDHGIDVIVTDHHAIPVSGPPKSAYAVLNPTRSDCAYPDPYIAGCMVAWLLMAGVRSELIRQDYLDKSSPSMTTLLDYVAVGTIADCVSMARSYNNRAVVHYGLKQINQFLRPCWQALKTNDTTIRSMDLGFKIGPLLNSDGRLSSALGSLSFLLADSLTEAQAWIEHLQRQNIERKSIQGEITLAAMQVAADQVRAGRQTLSIFLEAGHAGVHGICASRVKDAFGRPTIIFCPKLNEPELITGSARSIDAFHFQAHLQKIAAQYPDLIIKFGGHKGAAGLTLKRRDFAFFSEAFEKISSDVLSDLVLEPVIWSDGLCPNVLYRLEGVERLDQALEPFGREFEAPIFEAEGQLVSCQFIGETKLHARLSVTIADHLLNAIWFNARQSIDCSLSVEVGALVHMVFEPKINEFRNNKTINLQILQMNQI